MKKIVLLIALLMSAVCFGQVVLKPGQSTVVTASACPVPVVIHDSFYVHDTFCPNAPAPPITPPTVPPAGYTQTYSNNFDAGTILNQDQLGRGVISTSIFRSGTGSFKSEVRVGDPSISSGFRSEQQYTGTAQNPKEGAVEYDALYESWQSPGWAGSSIQWHPQGGGSAFLFLETAQQTFNTYQFKQGYKNTTTKITPNRWYHFRWEFKWSTASDGYARLYIDGSKFYEYSGATYSGAQPYLKLGQNFYSDSQDQTKAVHGGVVYYDNFSVLTKK